MKKNIINDDKVQENKKTQDSLNDREKLAISIASGFTKQLYAEFNKFRPNRTSDEDDLISMAFASVIGNLNILITELDVYKISVEELRNAIKKYNDILSSS